MGLAETIFGYEAPEFKRANGVAYLERTRRLYGGDSEVFLPESQPTRIFIDLLNEKHLGNVPKKGKFKISNLSKSGHLKAELEIYMGLSARKVKKNYGYAEYCGIYGAGKRPLKSIEVPGYYLPKSTIETRPEGNTLNIKEKARARSCQKKSNLYEYIDCPMKATELRANSGFRREKLPRPEKKKPWDIAKHHQGNKLDLNETSLKGWLTFLKNQNVLEALCNNTEEEFKIRESTRGIDPHVEKFLRSSKNKPYVRLLQEMATEEGIKLPEEPKFYRVGNDAYYNAGARQLLRYYSQRFGILP